MCSLFWWATQVRGEISCPLIPWYQKKQKQKKDTGYGVSFFNHFSLSYCQNYFSKGLSTVHCFNHCSKSEKEAIFMSWPCRTWIPTRVCKRGFVSIGFATENTKWKKNSLKTSAKNKRRIDKWSRVFKGKKSCSRTFLWRLLGGWESRCQTKIEPMWRWCMF